jgi:hypothetical protein
MTWSARALGVGQEPDDASIVRRDRGWLENLGVALSPLYRVPEVAMTEMMTGARGLRRGEFTLENLRRLLPGARPETFLQQARILATGHGALPGLFGAPTLDVETPETRAIDPARMVEEIAATATQFGGGPDVTEAGARLAGREWLRRQRQRELSGAFPSLYSPTGEEWLKFQKGGLLDPTYGGTLEMGVSFLDPTAFMPAGAALRALGRGGRAAARVAGRVPTGAFARALGGPTLASASRLRGLVRSFTPVSRLAHGQKAIKFGELANYAMRNYTDELDSLAARAYKVLQDAGVKVPRRGPGLDDLTRRFHRAAERPELLKAAGLPEELRPLMEELASVNRRILRDERMAGIATRAWRGQNAPAHYIARNIRPEYREWLKRVKEIKGEAVNLGGSHFEMSARHASLLHRKFGSMDELLDWSRDKGFFDWARKQGYRNPQVIELDPFLATKDRALRSVKAVSQARWMKSVADLGEEATEDLIMEGWRLPKNPHIRRFARLKPTPAELAEARRLEREVERLLRPAVRRGRVTFGDQEGLKRAFSSLHPEDLGYHATPHRRGGFVLYRDVAEGATEFVGHFRDADDLIRRLGPQMAEEGMNLLRRQQPELFETVTREFVEVERRANPLLAQRLAKQAASMRASKVFSPEVADAIDRTLSFLAVERKVDPFTRGARLFNRIFKPSQTIFWPAFVGRNALSNVVLNAIGGVTNPARYLEAAYMMAGVAPQGSGMQKMLSRGLLGRVIRRGGMGAAVGGFLAEDWQEGAAAGAAVGFGTVAAGGLARAAARRLGRWGMGSEVIPGLSRAQFMEEAAKRGILGGGFIQQEILKEAGRAGAGLIDKRGFLRRAWSPIYDTAAGANRAVEEHARLTHFLDKTRKLYKPGAPLEAVLDNAAIEAKKYLFDYGDLSAVERNLLKHWIPFYTFTRKNIPLQLETAVKHPFGTGQAAKLAAQRGFEKEELRDIPRWMRDTLTLKTGETVLRGFGTPMEEFIETGRPLRKGVSMLSPLLRAPLEAATGRSFFFERPLTARPLTPEIPGVGPALFKAAQEAGLASELEALVQGAPASRLLSEMRTRRVAEERGVGGVAEAVRRAMGVRAEPYDPEMLKMIARKERLADLEQEGLIRRPNVFALTEAGEESEEAQEELRILRLEQRRRRMMRGNKRRAFRWGLRRKQ